MKKVIQSMLSRQRKRWKPLLLLLAILATLGFRTYAYWDEISHDWYHIWNHDRPLESADHFFTAIADADRLVVRDGGFNCCGSVKDDPVLFTITNSTEMTDIREHIQFESYTNILTSGCGCCGYPGLDWYKGKKRLALTSVPHGYSIRWKEFGTSYSGPFRQYGDYPLTMDSAIWMTKWMRSHGITNDSYTEKDLKMLEKMAAIQKKESGKEPAQ